jgi:hypothetical protein
MAATKTLSGARAILMIGNTQVALCTGVSITQSIGYEPIHILDLLEVEEFVEVSYDASMSVETMRMVGNSPQNQGLFSYESLLTILNQPELVAVIIDALTGTPICKVEGLKGQGNNFDIRAGQAVANNLTFVCKRVLDPQDPQY